VSHSPPLTPLGVTWSPSLADFFSPSPLFFSFFEYFTDVFRHSDPPLPPLPDRSRWGSKVYICVPCYPSSPFFFPLCLHEDDPVVCILPLRIFVLRRNRCLTGIFDAWAFFFFRLLFYGFQSSMFFFFLQGFSFPPLPLAKCVLKYFFSASPSYSSNELCLLGAAGLGVSAPLF